MSMWAVVIDHHVTDGENDFTLASWTVPFSRLAAFWKAGANFLQWPHLPGAQVNGTEINDDDYDDDDGVEYRLYTDTS